MNQTKITEFGGMQCVQLKAGGYTALIAPQVG